MALDRYVAEEIALDCQDGLLTRREALRRLGLMGLSMAAATTLLAACSNDDDNPQAASTTQATTGSTTQTSEPITGVGEDITFKGPRGNLIGSWAAAETPKGAALVIHENRGLTDHIKSIPPRLAADGYSALAVDLLSEEGGTKAIGDEGKAQAALSAASQERLTADMKAALDELAKRAPGQKLAAIGFCYGGGQVWQLLQAGEPRLAAAVPFYGPAPDAPDFSRSKAAVLGVYAELDNRVNGSRDAADAALQQAGVEYQIRTFAGADHAFFNDTGPRYNEKAATEAYDALLAWFGIHLA
ncbi:MAG: carboxymethylenebutenolidase [Actinomycetota bacterium]|jgi:carboxymethylenebutenolidase